MAGILDEAGNPVFDEAGGPVADEAGPPFPDGALDLRPELLLNGAWTDVSQWNDHGPVTVTRGHPDESTTVTASTLALTLTNNDARFTGKNPAGPYYPYLTRNVQCRISVPSQAPYLRLEANSFDRAYVNDVPRLDITGSLEARIELRPSNWGGGVLACKWDGGGCWCWQLNGDGTMTLTWYDSGVVQHFATSTAPAPMLNAQVALRVTLNALTGAVTFYTAASIDGTYAQLGAVVSATGATSINTGPSALQVGYSFNFAPAQLLGSVTGFRLYNGIGGTVVADAAFSVQAPGATTWTDAPGNAWLLAGGAEISGRSYRGHFEVPEWRQRQDASGRSWTAEAAGGGLLRRLAQRNNPVSSTMRRVWTRAPLTSSLAVYWPMEDGAGSARFGPGAGGAAMYFGGSALPQLAASSAFACSGPLPVVNGSTFSGNVSYAGAWADNQTAFLMAVPSGGELNGSAICAVTSTGTLATLILSYWTGGGMSLTGYSAAGAQLFTSGVFNFNVNGKSLLVEVGLQNAGGGNITWSMQTLAPGAAGAGAASGTVAGTIGAVTRVQFNPYGSQGLLQTAFGHCAVRAAWVSLGQLGGALAAWAGEPAGVRFARLCAEEGIQFRGRGVMAATPLMGAQTAQTLPALLQECADADRGVWTELRQQLGFGYVTRSALYNQPAGVSVDYAQDHLGMWGSDPLEDDQTTVNDATVSQTTGGSSSRQYAAPGQPIGGGRLSTQAPPNGMGDYDQSYSVNLWQADDLDNEAGWIEHVGTVDQPRYPGIVLDLANRALFSQFWQILAMDLGDRLVIADPPAQLGPDPVSQLAQQLTETMWGKEWTIAVCGVPGQPYEVAALGAANADTSGTQLHAPVSATAVALAADVTAGPAWTTSPADLPLGVMVAGELMTVTAIGAAGAWLSGDDAVFGATAGNWQALSACQLAWQSAPSYYGTGTMLVTSTSATGSPSGSCNVPAEWMPVNAGDVVTVTAEFQAASTSRQCKTRVYWLNAAGGALSNASAGAANDNSSAWTTVSGSATAPAGAAYAVAGFSITSVTAIGEQHFIGAMQMANQTSSQKMTVARSANGVVKAQAAGAAVSVWPPPVIAL